LLISGFLSTVSVCFPAQIFPVFSDKSENFWCKSSYFSICGSCCVAMAMMSAIKYVFGRKEILFLSLLWLHPHQSGFAFIQMCLGK
jgi:hypothetical protein